MKKPNTKWIVIIVLCGIGVFFTNAIRRMVELNLKNNARRNGEVIADKAIAEGTAEIQKRNLLVGTWLSQKDPWRDSFSKDGAYRGEGSTHQTFKLKDSTSVITIVMKGKIDGEWELDMHGLISVTCKNADVVLDKFDLIDPVYEKEHGSAGLETFRRLSEQTMAKELKDSIQGMVIKNTLISINDSEFVYRTESGDTEKNFRVSK